MASSGCVRDSRTCGEAHTAAHTAITGRDTLTAHTPSHRSRRIHTVFASCSHRIHTAFSPYSHPHSHRMHTVSAGASLRGRVAAARLREGRGSGAAVQGSHPPQDRRAGDRGLLQPRAVKAGQGRFQPRAVTGSRFRDRTQGGLRVAPRQRERSTAGGGKSRYGQ